MAFLKKSHKNSYSPLEQVTALNTEQLTENESRGKTEILRSEMTFSRLALSLARDYVSVYYINIETGAYIEYGATSGSDKLLVLSSGEDFFKDAFTSGEFLVHPDDRREFFARISKKSFLEVISTGVPFTLNYRLLVDGKYLHYSLKTTHKQIDGAVEMAEILWRADRSKDADQEARNYPPTLDGKGRVNPSQNLVDAFPMRSGRPITDPNSGYDPQNPYANRDPRLDDDILYNGTTFRRTVIITGTYPNEDDKNLKTLDNINNNIEKGSTRTGYYLKKLLRNDVSPLSSSLITQQHIYPRIRYTEIFLAYAEAANDAWGPKADPKGIGYTAYDVIKKIRQRAGLGKDFMGMDLPEGDSYLEECAADQTKMTDLIRNERRIELCFENKRFWDLRRWLLPLNEPVRGMQIDCYSNGDIKYTVFPVVDDRKFDNSFQCYGPIPKSEVLKWSNLKQNRGWEIY